jgi:type VI secretion system protein ImpA
LGEILDKIKEYRIEEDPSAYAEDDPMRPQNPKRANWTGIVQLATQTLAGKSKDLLLAAYLTEAMLKVHSFAGLRDSLLLFRELVGKCWDRLLPAIEDGDVEVRAGPFNLLDDPVKGIRFPTSVRLAPLVVTKEGAFCYMDRNPPDPSMPPRVSNEEWDKAIRAAYVKTCQQNLEDVAQCLEHLNQLTETLRAQMGPQDAPGMTGLRPALEGCQFFLQQVIRKAGGDSPPRTASGGGSKGEAVNQEKDQSPSGRPAASTRAEAYRQLAQAAAVLKELEPHSPIPYLVHRAIELGSLSFPELIRALVRNAEVVAEINREMGIKSGE